MCKRERRGAGRSRPKQAAILPVTSLHNSRAPSSELPALRLRRRLPHANQVIEEREGGGSAGTRRPRGRARARARALLARGARAAAAAAACGASGVSEERERGTHGRGREAGMSHTEK